MAPKVLTTEHSWNKKRKLERQEKTFRNFGKLYNSKCQSKNTDANENNIQNGVQQVNFAESNNKIAKLTTKTLKNQRQKILETSSINKGIQKPDKGRNSIRNEELKFFVLQKKTHRSFFEGFQIYSDVSLTLFLHVRL